MSYGKERGESPRVMHVLPNLDIAGIPRAIIDLIENVPDLEMSVAAAVRGGDCQEEFEARCPTVVVGDEQGDPFRSYLWFKPAPILHLAQAMRELQPNIVQTHTFPAAVVGRVAAKLAGVPVIVDTLHNTYSWKQPRDLRIDRLFGTVYRSNSLCFKCRKRFCYRTKPNYSSKQVRSHL